VLFRSSPVTALVFGISRIFFPKSGEEPFKKHSFASREELELLLNIPAHGSDVQKKEKKLIQQIFQFSRAEAHEVMIPLVSVSALPSTATVNDVNELIRKTGFSRIPIFKDRIYNLVGIVRAFDIVSVENPNVSIKPFIREIPYVPEMKKIGSLLVFLQKSRKSMAIAVDEYGGGTGIITVEDILEEIVGDIRDEHDHVVNAITRLDKNRYRVNARIEVDDLNEQLSLSIPKEHFETLGGFVLYIMGRIPRPGESFVWEGNRFKISQANKRTVMEVLIEMDIGKDTLTPPA
jgi:CBS domain containing-hemolysin-like protein